jgi:hypothetical protein
MCLLRLQARREPAETPLNSTGLHQVESHITVFSKSKVCGQLWFLFMSIKSYFKLSWNQNSLTVPEKSDCTKATGTEHTTNTSYICVTRNWSRMWNPDVFHMDNKPKNIPLVLMIINHILLDLQRQLFAIKTETYPNGGKISCISRDRSILRSQLCQCNVINQKHSFSPPTR